LCKPIAKSIGKGKFRLPQLRNRLIDFYAIRTLELYLLKTTHHEKTYFDPTMWVVSASANIQLATVTEKTISGVHVSPGSADTLVRKDGITNDRSIACSLSNIS